MNIPLSSLLLFFLAMSCGLAAVVEGMLIIGFHKQITPIPVRILRGMGDVVIGKEKSSVRFAGQNTPETLRTYAIFALTSGILLVVCSFIYLGNG